MGPEPVPIEPMAVGAATGAFLIGLAAGKPLMERDVSAALGRLPRTISCLIRKQSLDFLSSATCPRRWRSARRGAAAPRVEDSPGFLSEETHAARKTRNEMAINVLKTNDPAKWLISRPNDFNALRPASRNRWFRLRNERFRFCGFWPPRGSKRNGRSRLCPAASPPPPLGSAAQGRIAGAWALSSPAQRGGGGALRKRSRWAVTKLRESALKLMKSLSRVTLCAGPAGSRPGPPSAGAARALNSRSARARRSPA
jgi:hypothetical protein